MNTREYLTIHRNSYSIVMSLAADVNPSLFARKLHAADLVSRHVLEKARVVAVSAPERFDDMIQAVQSKIQLDASTFHTFLQTLKDLCPLLARVLMTYYGEWLVGYFLYVTGFAKMDHFSQESKLNAKNEKCPLFRQCVRNAMFLSKCPCHAYL